MEADWSTFVDGQIAEALDVLMRGRALRLFVTHPVGLSMGVVARDDSGCFSLARATRRCFLSEFSSSFLNASLRSSTKATASGSSSCGGFEVERERGRRVEGRGGKDEG